MNEAIKDDLLILKKACDEASISFVIEGGIVLGYARYGDIMPWDTDIDASIFTEPITEQLDILYAQLIHYGFRDINYFKTDFCYGFRKTELNLWLFHKNGDYYEAFPKSTPGLKFIEKCIWFDDPQSIDFIGSNFLFPNNIDDYLVCLYGTDWKTNIIKNHEEYYLDKRGSRNVAEWPAGRATKDGDMWPKVLKISDNMEN